MWALAHVDSKCSLSTGRLRRFTSGRRPLGRARGRRCAAEVASRRGLVTRTANRCSVCPAPHVEAKRLAGHNRGTMRIQSGGSSMFCAQCGQRVSRRLEVLQSIAARPSWRCPPPRTRGLTGAAHRSRPYLGRRPDPLPMSGASAASSSGAERRASAGSNVDAAQGGDRSHANWRAGSSRVSGTSCCRRRRNGRSSRRSPRRRSAIYLRYVAPLVAIGVIATFLGQTLDRHVRRAARDGARRHLRRPGARDPDCSDCRFSRCF